MTVQPMANRAGASARLLLITMAAAVILRIAGALYLGNRVEALPGIADQSSYHELAVRLLQGHGFSFAVGWWPATPAGQPTAHWSFLYVLFLAGVYLVVGPNALGARLLQAALVGVLHTFLTFRIGSRLFGQRVGLLAAALAGCNAYFIYYSGALMTESFYIVCVLWTIDIATSMADLSDRRAGVPSARSWALLGVAMGAAALLRQTFLLIVPFVLIWAVWRTSRFAERGNSRLKSWLRQSRYAMLAVAVMLTCILPWTFRNYKAYDRFVLLNTNAGFAFFWANHPIYGSKFIPVLGAGQPTYGSLIPDDLRNLDEAQLDRALLRRGIGFVWADPARYLRLSASRAKEYFRFWPGPTSGGISNIARTLSFGLTLPFLVVGIACTVFARRRLPGYREDSGHLLQLILLIAGAYTAIHLASWTLIRYRLPVDALLMPFAAAAVLMLARQFRWRERTASTIGASRAQSGVES